MDRSPEILEAVEELLGPSEFEVVDVQCAGDPRGFTVRVFLDKPGGPSIEDCARVSRAIGDHFEAVGLFSDKYILEVSSPGINRPLRRPDDFDRFRGETVRIETYERIDGSHKLRGVLAGYEPAEDAILVQTEEGRTLRVPRGAVKKAHLKRDPWEGVREKKPRREPRGRRRAKEKRAKAGRPEKGNA